MGRTHIATGKSVKMKEQQRGTVMKWLYPHTLCTSWATGRIQMSHEWKSDMKANRKVEAGVRCSFNLSLFFTIHVYFNWQLITLTPLNQVCFAKDSNLLLISLPLFWNSWSFKSYFLPLSSWEGWVREHLGGHLVADAPCKARLRKVLTNMINISLKAKYSSQNFQASH